jgi:hypothetical protein
MQREKSHGSRQQKGASHGQPRQARSREEEAKENGNQEHTGKAKARIQTDLATTTDIANP